MVNARGCLPALFWRREEPRSPSARAQFLNKKPRTVASGIGWRDDAGPFAAIDQHHRRAALRHGRCAASPGRSKCPGGVSHLRGAELAIAVRILPTLPAGAAELAREIEALDVIGIAGPGAATFRRGKRNAAGRQHRDIAAIGPVENAKAPLLKPAEIEGMLDNLAETRCFDRV